VGYHQLGRAARQGKKFRLCVTDVRPTPTENRLEEWQIRTLSDADLHGRNQLKHGSWILQLQIQPATVKT